ncbi:MAG: ABC transporter permease subunit [Odoribacter sp.]|nr:ABC transporter permease subunit [Odoribacter sp.]
MSTVKILVKKELNIHFNSWSIYIGYIIFFCICGFYAWLSGDNLFYIGQATMMPVFTVINWTQFFVIPALTMRSIAEEKRNGCLELMLTKPIKTAELISGKFLANLIITSIALLLTLPYYVTISALGAVDHGTVFLGYVGLICMSACYISIGILASALSRTAVTAFFISFSIGLCFQLLFGTLAEQIGSGFIAVFFSYLSMTEHFDTLSRGIFDSRDIIYFGSVCAIFLVLSKFFICKSRF